MASETKGLQWASQIPRFRYQTAVSRRRVDLTARGGKADIDRGQCPGRPQRVGLISEVVRNWLPVSLAFLGVTPVISGGSALRLSGAVGRGGDSRVVAATPWAVEVHMSLEGRPPLKASQPLSKPCWLPFQFWHCTGARSLPHLAG